MGVARYKILMHDGREATVEGDTLEVVAEPRASANRGDLLVKKEGHTVAHFWASEVAAYYEIEPDPPLRGR
jgi:hypothetical protein